MKTQDFWYHLPEELIAQTPLEKRDSSRLLVLDKVSGEIGHRHFYDIVDYLNPGDCLVMNDSRVLPARLLGNRPTGGAVELLLLKDLGDKQWECLAKPGRKLLAGQEVIFGGLGQTLTIRHDSLSRESFMPGIALAAKKVQGWKGLVEDLENIL